MSHIHVCLVSEQTVPNIMGIWHFRPDDLLFVSTEKMESNKTVEHILQTLSYIGMDFKDRYQKIVVKEDSLLDCKKKLDEWIAGKESAEFTVNLTGGTKIMSIAAYEYFKDYGSSMGYIPIGRNDFITIFPKKTKNAIDQISLRLSVHAYLTAYGLKVINLKRLASNHAEALSRKKLSEWIIKNYHEVKPLLERFSEKLRKHRDDKDGYLLTTSYSPRTNQEIELLANIGFAKDKDGYTKQLSQSEIIYLTGGWLEELCYNELLQFKGSGIDDIVIGVIAEKQGNKNEFDVMFTKDNALYTIECKSLDQGDDPRAEALYKIAALQKEFGLRVESFFVSTSPHILKDGKLKPSIQARAEQFNTTVIKPSDVINLAQIVAGKLKIKLPERYNG